MKKNRPYRVIFASDFHGLLLDKASFNCFIKILKGSDIDEVVLNGDILDLPYLSRHHRRLYEGGMMRGYSEVKEIEFAKKLAITSPEEGVELFESFTSSPNAKSVTLDTEE